MVDGGTGEQDVEVDRSPFWPWLLLLVLGLAAGIVLAWRPWWTPSARPEPSPSTVTTESAAPSPSDTPSPGPTSAALFDATTVPTLFFTDAELAQGVPEADGLSLAVADEAVWGLPEGSSVEPAECTTAVTIVEDEPEVFQRRFAANDTVTVIQTAVLLPDTAGATAAFDALVTTLGQCTAFQQVTPGVDGGSWVAEPPATEDGGVSTVVRRLTLTAEGATSPEVEVTTLAGNALVTTTASGVDPTSDPADPDDLAAVARTSAERALGGLG